MGACLSADDAAANQRNTEIERQIAMDAEKFKRECKILLLGSGESGKSTIVKQMKIIHQNGYSRDELVGYRSTVFANTIDSMRALVEAIRGLGLDYELEPNRAMAVRFLDLLESRRLNADGPRMLPEAAAIIESIWKDPVIPRVLARSSEFYMLDSAPYFFAEIRRISGGEYIPNEQDVLRARIKTTGIIETRFTMGQLHIHMFDVGGQRSERKKWIHCFEAVTSIIFCVALSEYDQTLLEDSTQNRMAESLVLFESVINARWFLRTSIILFLNKVDLFKEKLTKVPMSKYFEDFTGGDDLNKAAKYILYKFTLLNRAKLKIYPHLTCATDTSNIRLVFAAVKDTILQNALKDSGIL
ncbi:guanine nucleotide-binding protein alpha-3 subunit [Catenaria anguillulae PL171]|uniref:Guanine nucleotide-binding protein alpha-3 subunit n=1 Tax=Catenaria anguillulae PL171 TaxID=765915 RepID=A0A1Y2HTC8_9FUNG|nr:guanine nucleotide-binding protein alpha-3 subunit [Catenaria anguillulae PL171]